MNMKCENNRGLINMHGLSCMYVNMFLFITAFCITVMGFEENKKLSLLICVFQLRILVVN